MKVIDAEGHAMGRLASYVAKDLLSGEEVVILNSDKAIIVGKPKEIVNRYKDKRTLNHPRKGPHYPRRPDMMVKRTIRGMLPYQKPSGRAALKRLRVYAGVPQEFKGVKAGQIEGALKPNAVEFLTVAEVSRELGSKMGADLA